MNSYAEPKSLLHQFTLCDRVLTVNHPSPWCSMLDVIATEPRHTFGYFDGKIKQLYGVKCQLKIKKPR